MVTVFHYTPVNAKQFDGVNIDSLVGKRKNVNISARQNLALYTAYRIAGFYHEH